MEPLLDADPKPTATTSSLFSKIALLMAIIAMILLVTVFKNVGDILNQEMSFMDFRALLIAYMVATIIGAGFSIIAVIRPEPANRIRTIALFLNIFLFFFLIGLFFFGNIGP
jgi:hypothetical protein